VFDLGLGSHVLGLGLGTQVLGLGLGDQVLDLGLGLDVCGLDSVSAYVEASLRCIMSCSQLSVNFNTPVLFFKG